LTVVALILQYSARPHCVNLSGKQLEDRWTLVKLQDLESPILRLLGGMQIFTNTGKL
jgi:hypothetical protein